jgi:hypothetical protein
VVVLQTDQLLRTELPLDVLQQIRNEVDVNQCLSTVPRLVKGEKTELQLPRV